MEPPDLAELRQKSEAAELAALEAERELARCRGASRSGRLPNATVAHLIVRAQLLRYLAEWAKMSYCCIVCEPKVDPVCAQCEQAPQRAEASLGNIPISGERLRFEGAETLTVVEVAMQAMQSVEPEPFLVRHLRVEVERLTTLLAASVECEERMQERIERHEREHESLLAGLRDLVGELRTEASDHRVSARHTGLPHEALAGDIKAFVAAGLERRFLKGVADGDG